MRTYYRATGGVDGAIQTLLFWAVILTAPIWVPVIGLIVLYEALFPKKYEQVPVPTPAPIVYTTPASIPQGPALAGSTSAICRSYIKLEALGRAHIAEGQTARGTDNIKYARKRLQENGC